MRKAFRSRLCVLKSRVERNEGILMSTSSSTHHMFLSSSFLRFPEFTNQVGKRLTWESKHWIISRTPHFSLTSFVSFDVDRSASSTQNFQHWSCFLLFRFTTERNSTRSSAGRYICIGPKEIKEKKTSSTKPPVAPLRNGQRSRGMRKGIRVE
jgi:hypothetical protein